jgi:two-component system cell cycle sensor histidine kinase/response regulator CckA
MSEQPIIQNFKDKNSSDERTAEQKEQFRQGQKLETIGALALGIVHDFNNLLTVINGYSNLILEKVPRGSLLFEQLSEIKKAGECAAKLTKQLLDFSRNQILDSKVIDINIVVNNLQKTLQRLIREEIKLSVSLKTKIGFIRAK